MKKELIEKIIAEIEPSQNTILSEWPYLDGTGGYFIRKDGEIFTIGDDGAQTLSTESYSHLNQLNENELSKIFANLVKDSDLLNDIKTSPECFSYSNIEQFLNWVEKIPSKSLKIK